MIELDKTVVIMDGRTFEIIPHVPPVDVSATNETEFPTELTHKIKGFGDEIHVIAEATGDNHIGFSFGYFIGNTGLFVPVEDENVVKTATEVIFTALKAD